ncbi:MAG TPA: ribbon-helix-helix protein, CopG family [Rhodanobacteraceae bacterium]|nr:ribbon-helix-helix protein, CopG family [Rhodanobacteraceae bacterium]
MPRPSSPSDEIRINARLTGEDARRFRELQRREDMSASDLLRDALREYHAMRLRPRTDAATLLESSGFLGGGEGPADLSTRYKSYLTDTLEDKVPLRVSEPKPDDYRG